MAVDEKAPLVHAHASGSGFTHLAQEGWMITLCGRVALYRVANPGRRSTCGRCKWEARTRGLALPDRQTAS